MVLLKVNKAREKKKCTFYQWDIVQEEGREVIQHWREKRLRLRGARKSYHEFMVYSFSLDMLKSFFQNINFMVVIQMALAMVAVYIFQFCEISFDLNVSLFVSPIVFPLAFAINTDFQRREKVLEDLAVFKSSGMVWYFCMREWKEAAELDSDWISAVHAKLKSLLFHLREYLLTSKIVHRKIILRAMYEDFSDANQLIEKVRASKLPANTAAISRSIHLLNMMCLSFERLRVVREYRSPRSIRSFNKVLIMFLPIIIAPYFVFLGKKCNNKWEPYYIAMLVAFVFSSLQGVQDKLDDPFDGMSEDDIDLDTIDEWTFGSLEHTMKRSFDVGRFKVTVDLNADPKVDCSPRFTQRTAANGDVLCRTNSASTVPLLRTSSIKEQCNPKDEIAAYRKFAPILEGMKGNTRITRKSTHRKHSGSNDQQLDTVFEAANVPSLNEIIEEGDGTSVCKVTINNDNDETEYIDNSDEDCVFNPDNESVDSVTYSFTSRDSQVALIPEIRHPVTFFDDNHKHPVIRKSLSDNDTPLNITHQRNDISAFRHGDNNLRVNGNSRNTPLFLSPKGRDAVTLPTGGRFCVKASGEKRYKPKHVRDTLMCDGAAETAGRNSTINSPVTTSTHIQSQGTDNVVYIHSDMEMLDFNKYQ